MNEVCVVRAAEEHDVDLILDLISELAGYEQMADQVVATPARLTQTLFGPDAAAEVLLAESGDACAGFALYFQNYSTFLGKPGIYLEDLYVRLDFRGQGVGLLLLKSLAVIAIDRGCERLDWMVLDWNETAISFYEKLGAKRVDRFCPFRLSGDALKSFATND